MMRSFYSRLIAAFVLVIGLFGKNWAQVESTRPSVPLHYDVALAAAGFPNPLVRATINGQKAIFIVDTGASVNTLATWFAKAASLPVSETSATVRGSTGGKAHIQVVRGISGVFENGTLLRLDEAIVADLPRVFHDHQLGGLLSPQLLAPAGLAAVLDLRVPVLAFEPFNHASAQLPREAAGFSTGNECTNRDSQFTNRQYSARISVEDVRGTLLLDTGATRTLVVPKSSIARKLSFRSIEKGRTAGVGGAVTNDRRVANVHLKLGGMKTILDLTVGGSPSNCGPDGLLGMDALGKCVLLLDVSRLAFSCEKQ
jgi:predicted aspartyl protease